MFSQSRFQRQVVIDSLILPRAMTSLVVNFHCSSCLLVNLILPQSSSIDHTNPRERGVISHYPQRTGWDHLCRKMLCSCAECAFRQLDILCEAFLCFKILSDPMAGNALGTEAHTIFQREDLGPNAPHLICLAPSNTNTEVVSPTVLILPITMHIIWLGQDIAQTAE